jgi:pimeloyl-ACP methyl ester carboxylesterase
MLKPLLLAATVGAAAAIQNTPPPPLPAPGRLVDVGGWRLHLNCTGTRAPGAPLVVLEAGIGDFSVEWSLVQSQVSKFARVCSYDRAGDGWSDWGPHPRTFRQIVYELHTLLERAGEKPPLVLVGQSYGGWLVRVYTSAHPSAVDGLVFVDGGRDDPLRMRPDGPPVPASQLAKGEPIPPVKTSGPLQRSDLSERIVAAMSAQMPEAVRHANYPPRDQLPEDAQRMRTWALGQLGHVAAGVNPVEVEEQALLHQEFEAKPNLFGDRPVIVLTRGRPDGPGDSQEQEAANRESHRRLAGKSTAGRLIVAERSGHHIHIEQPQLVAEAIAEVVKKAAKH